MNSLIFHDYPTLSTQGILHTVHVHECIIHIHLHIMHIHKVLHAYCIFMGAYLAYVLSSECGTCLEQFGFRLVRVCTVAA